MHDTEWILLDTETTGLKPPIFVVELAAQRMKGWNPTGPSFRRLLNQNEDIPPEATRVHGYTREILERDGDLASNVYRDFMIYTEGLPMVAYNLRYDWDEVLIPEWNRLGISPIGSRGFCALRLAQRLLDPVPAGNCKLQTLRQFYRLPERGAHTAMGDVQTVIDLLKNVLAPLAHENKLNSWKELVAYSEEEYFPTRIAFGKFKGRAFQDAAHDPELRDWLEWLAKSENERSKRMGTWYLARLEASRKPFTSKLSDESTGCTVNGKAANPEQKEIIAYADPEIERLLPLIEAARTRLAELEANYANDQRAVANVRAIIFTQTHEFYRARDRLKLKIHYREMFLDKLLKGGEEEAEEVTEEYEQAAADNEEDYNNAAQEAKNSSDLSDEQKVEIKEIFLKLVKLFHPDRHASDPQQRKVYEDLTAIINGARDSGDLGLLQEISTNPEVFIKKKGWSSLDFEESHNVDDLRALYDTLQIKVIELLELLNELHASPDYELFILSKADTEILKEIADEQIAELTQEISELEQKAEKLLNEIEGLLGHSFQDLN